MSIFEAIKVNLVYLIVIAMKNEDVALRYRTKRLYLEPRALLVRDTQLIAVTTYYVAL